MPGGWAALAAREIEAGAAAGERMPIQPLVLCEMVWVLESAYRFGKHEIPTILERIPMTAQFEIAQKDIVWAAWGDYHPHVRQGIEGRASLPFARVVTAQ